MAERVTLLDVARRCKVSKATVSRVLNDPGGTISFRPRTRKRIQQAAQKLGYRPNHRAQALARNRSEAVGILYFSEMPPQGHQFEDFFKAFLGEIRRDTYHAVFIPAQYALEDWDRFAWQERVDGLVVAERIKPEWSEFLARSGLPVILCNSDDEVESDSIAFADYLGARQATEHLLSLGHRRIRCWILNSDHYSARRREEGFLDTLRQAGVECGEKTVIRTSNEDFGQFIGRCLDEGPMPTAMLIYSHFQAIQAVKLLHERGLRVPEDISIATFNDVFPVESIIPSLTCVHLPYDDMGRLAARMILDKIRGKSGPCPPVVLPETLIVRESTGKAR